MFRNVYESEFDCKGQFWFELFDCVMVGLMLGTLSLGGVMSTYTGFWDFHPAALWVLAGIISFMHARWKWRWRRLCGAITYQDAANVDSDTSEFGSQEVVKSFDPRYYVDPIIKLIDANEANEAEAAKDELESPKVRLSPCSARTPIVPPTPLGKPQLEACGLTAGKVRDLRRRPRPVVLRTWLACLCPWRRRNSVDFSPQF
eukprot:UN3135